MPRVTTHTKSNRGKRTYTCRGCGKAIQPGEQYRMWEKRVGGLQFMHVACGYPKPSMLSNRKTAVVEDAIEDATDTISKWTPSLDELGYDDVKGALEQVADEAEAVGQEYSEGADNMPENLQYGTQAEAMREVGQELESWAEELRSWEPNEEEPDLNDDMDDEEREAALEQWANDLRDDATDKMSDLPEYQG
jgi:hypothetical protein